MNRNRNQEHLDEFIIDDQSPKRHSVKAQKSNNDFVSLDQDDDYQPLKLPTIKQEKNNQQPNKPNSRQRQNKKKIDTEQNQYFEQIDDEPMSNDEKVDNKLRGKQPEIERKNNQDEYEEDDFEEDMPQEPVNNYRNKDGIDNKIHQYHSQNQPLKNIAKNILPNKSSNIAKFNGSRPKQQSLYKSGSKNSMRSNHTNLSLRKVVDKEKEEGRRFSAQVEKNFPQIDVGRQSGDQLQKLNEKIRGMIRNLNTELNEILNRVTQEQKKPQPEKKNVEEAIKVMLEAKKNNQKILQRNYAQLKKLQGRVGSIKGEDYEEDITTQVSSLTSKKKQLQKFIAQMKVDININEKKPLAISKRSIQVLKTDLFNLKRDVEKHETKENQLEEKLNQLTEKHDTAQRKHKDIIEQASDKGISIASSQINQAKQKQLVQKQKALRKGIQNTETLYKSKGDIMNNENHRFKREIINCEAQIKDFYNQIVQLATKSATLIEKEKENPKLMKNVLSSLQAFSKSIANTPPIDFNQGNETQFSSPSLQSRDKVRSIKHENHYSQKDKSPIKGLKDQKSEDRNSNKPNFKKQREKAEDKLLKQDEKREDLKLQIIQEVQNQVQKTKSVVNNLKPTFNFKKKSEIFKETSDKQLQIPETTKQQNSHPNVIPSPTQNTDNSEKSMKPFTRFRRNSNIQQPSSFTQVEQPHKALQIKKQVLQHPAIQQSQAIAPKKFILKRRGNQEENEPIYNPTVADKSQNSHLASQRSHQQQPKQETKIKHTNIQSSFKEPLNGETSQDPLPPRKRNSQQNPKNGTESFQSPALHIQKQEKSIQDNPIKSVIQPKQRQGKLKKQKINLQSEKVGNIYSQAEDVTNEFMIKEQQKIKEIRQDEQEIDLNGLIGIKKPKKQDQQDLMFDEKKVKRQKQKPKGTKGDDFFGFDL